jgi:hypothetical protein
MGFEFAKGWDVRIFGALDARMNQTLQKGLEVARATVHVRTGKLKASIGGGFNQDTRTLMIWADEPYAWVEEFRTPGNHHYLLPAMQAMAGLWNGHYNLEAHYMNAAAKGKHTTLESLRAREEAGRKSQLGFLARRKAKIVTRRHHPRLTLNTPSPNDATTPIL